jgi:hypothetical protein
MESIGWNGFPTPEALLAGLSAGAGTFLVLWALLDLKVLGGRVELLRASLRMERAGPAEKKGKGRRIPLLSLAAPALIFLLWLPVHPVMAVLLAGAAGLRFAAGLVLGSRREEGKEAGEAARLASLLWFHMAGNGAFRSAWESLRGLGKRGSSLLADEVEGVLRGIQPPDRVRSRPEAALLALAAVSGHAPAGTVRAELWRIRRWVEERRALEAQLRTGMLFLVWSSRVLGTVGMGLVAATALEPHLWGFWTQGAGNMVFLTLLTAFNSLGSLLLEVAIQEMARWML